MSKSFYIFLFLSLNLTAQIKVETLVDNINASGGLKIFDNQLYAANFGQSLDNANGTEVYKVNADGSYNIFANGLFGASGNDFDSQGNLFQSNIAGDRVSKILPNGQVSTFATNGIECNVGIVIDPIDNLYVCNCCGQQGNTIRKVTPQGQVSLFASGTLFNCPNGITIDENNNLYVSNFSNGNIIKITPDGQSSLLATTPGGPNSPASNGHIYYSKTEGVLYVASHGSHSIYRLSLGGVLTRIAGTGLRGNNDGDENTATFSRPNGIAINERGDSMYVNSSIPITDAGGRPLNPSKIRLITAFYNTLSNNAELILADFDIYPNPAKDQLYIGIPINQNKLIKFSIYDMNGLLLKKESEFANAAYFEKKINISELSSGTFILNVSIENKTVSRLFNKI